MPNETNTGTRAYVPGKQVTVAHLIAHPAPEICEKAGIPDVDAIGILTLTPGETAIIAGDMAVRSADVNVAFLDRFSGTLILYGSVGAVEQALTQVNDMLNRLLQFTICPVTRHAPVPEWGRAGRCQQSDTLRASRLPGWGTPCRFQSGTGASLICGPGALRPLEPLGAALRRC